MLRSEAVSLIQEGLGWTTQRSDSIILRLKQAQRLLEQGRSLPWFLIQENQSFALASGSADTSLPSGFIREVFRRQFHYTDDSSGSDEEIFLEKVTIEEGKLRFIATDDGKPQAYTVLKSTVKIYPNRDVAYTLYWDYYKAATVLDSNVENDWLLYAPDVLIGAAGKLMADDLANDRASEKFQSLFNAAWAGMFADGIEREDENDPVVIGGRL